MTSQLLKVEQWIFLHKALTAAVSTLSFVALILPVNESLIFFSMPNSTHAVLSNVLVRVVYGVILFLTVCWLLSRAEKIRRHDPVAVRWLKAALIYLALSGVVLVLIWPGFWVWDEFYTLFDVRNSSGPVESLGYTAWQGGVTVLYYLLILLTFPTGVGIVVFQWLFSATVVGYIVARTAAGLKRPRLAYLTMVPFALAPVLLNNFYPLRLTPTAYIEVLLIFRLLFIAKDPRLIANKYAEFLGLTTLITLLALWRPEGIYYLLLVPLLVVTLKLFNGRKRVLPALATLAIGSLLLVSVFSANQSTKAPAYQLTAIINPLSMMLQHELSGPDVQENLDVLSRSLDLSIVKSLPSYEEIPAYWAGAANDRLRTNDGAALIAFGKIVLNNPVPFLQARFQTFLASNRFDSFSGQIHGGGAAVDADVVGIAGAKAVFEDNNYLATSPWPQLKPLVVRSLLMVDESLAPVHGSIFVWSVIPVGVALVGALMVHLVTRRLLYAALIVLAMGRVVLVFLSAPASYFMYYFPFYLTGGALASYFLVRFMNRFMDRPRSLSQ